MPATVSKALRRLTAAAEGAELARLCRRQRIELMVVFGSAARGEPEPADLDLGVAAEKGARVDVLGLVDDLYRMTGFETSTSWTSTVPRPWPGSGHWWVPGCCTRRGPVSFALRQIAAIMERLDTDPLRRLELELMAP